MKKYNIFFASLFLVCFLFSLTLKSQTEISGRITDNENNYLQGANVVIVETGEGSTTNTNGEFFIQTQFHGHAEINVSFVGFKTYSRKIKIKPQKTVYQEIKLTRLVLQAEVVEIKAEAEKRPLNKPFRIEIIGQTGIDALPANSADQLFVSSPGVNVNRQFGIYDDKAVVSLRGQSGSDQSRTLVMVDGVPVNKSDGGSVNWNFIRPENVDHIEITKGPGLAKYGSSAMGGSINIVTARPVHRFKVEAQAEAGQWNTLGGIVNISGKSADSVKNPLWYSINGMARISDGYINQPEETIIMYDSVVVPSFLREQSAQTRLGYQISSNHKIDMDINFYNDKRGRGIKIYEDDGSWSSHQTWFAKMGYQGKVKGFEINVRAYYLLENYYKVNEYFSEGEYVLYDVNSQRTDLGIFIDVAKKIGKHQILSGAELRRGKVDASDIYYTATDKIDNRGMMDLGAFFVMDEMSFFNNKLQVNAGLRLDMARFSNGEYLIQNPSYSLEYMLNFQDTVMNTNNWVALNPKLSINYFLQKGVRTFVSVARGFRAPVLDDMCRSGKRKNGFSVANPNLGPEYITSVEWGFDWRVTGNLHIGISAYYSYGKDYIYSVSTGDSVNMGYTISPVYKVENIGGVDISGIEAEVSGKVTSQVSFFANYTRNFSEITKFTPHSAADLNLTGNHLTDVPDHQANAGIGWQNRIVNINLIGKYIGKRWINDYNIPDITYLFAPQYPAYFNLDIKIQKQITPNLHISLSIENMLDETHINNRGYKTPGRFVMGKIMWRSLIK